MVDELEGKQRCPSSLLFEDLILEVRYDVIQRKPAGSAFKVGTEPRVEPVFMKREHDMLE